MFGDEEDDWRAWAVCRGLDPDIFYPHYERDSGPAKKVCETCPVREPCLEWALSTRQPYGVWGGLTEKERRSLLRRRARQRLRERREMEMVG